MSTSLGDVHGARKHSRCRNSNTTAALDKLHYTGNGDGRGRKQKEYKAVGMGVRLPHGSHQGAYSGWRDFSLSLAASLSAASRHLRTSAKKSCV